MTHKADMRAQIAKKIAQGKISTSLSRYVQSGQGRGAPSQAAIDDRDRRALLPEARDNTGQLLGDPPLERSALYKKLHGITDEPEAKSIWEGIDLDISK